MNRIMWRRVAGVRVFAVVAAILMFAAAPSDLRAQANEFLTYQFRIGTGSGSGPGQFIYPFGIAVDSTGRFIVTDTESYDPVTGEVALASNRIQIFLPDGTFEREAAGTGSLPGQLWYPIGAAVDALDRIVIADANNNRIQVFSPAATPGGPQFLAEYGTFGNYDPLDPTSSYPTPAPPDEFYLVTGVALRPGTRLFDPTDTIGRVAIVDLGNHRVVVLNSQLEYVLEFGGHSTDDNPTGTFEYPWGVAVGAGGEYYVTDPSNHRVQAFNAAGQFLWTFGADTTGRAPAPGELSAPSAIALDGVGRLLVADTDRSRVLRIDLATDIGAGSTFPSCADLAQLQPGHQCRIATSDGHHYGALVLGSYGWGEDQFAFAQGVAADLLGRVAVVDTDQHAVKVFQPAKIEISSATAAAPPTGARVDQPITLQATVANAGGSTLTVSLALDASLLGTVTGNTPASIAPGAEHTFVLTFVPQEPGSLSISVRAEGLHATGARVAAVPVGITPPLDVAPALEPKLVVSIVADRLTVGVGQTIGLTVRLVNSGNTTFETITPLISASPAGLVTVTPGSPLDLSPLVPGTRDLNFVYTTLQEGKVTFTAAVTATYADPDVPSASRTYPAPPAPPLSASSGEISIRYDTIPPVTTVTPSTAAEPSGWYRAPFSVALSADDNGGSGVQTITYRSISLQDITTTTTQNPVSVPINFEGLTTVIYHATDKVGNSESPHTINLRLDSVAPAMGRAEAIPGSNPAGWNKTDVVVTFVAGDGTSGVAYVTPPVMVTTEGAGQIVKGTARDVAGNESQAQTVLNIDKTPPALSYTVSRAPNTNGWHNAPVTVTFSAVDQPGLSGVASVSPAQTISSDGIVTVTGSAIDVAGNTSFLAVTIKLDRTPPVVSCRTVSGGLVWPPNHQLVPWETAVLVTDVTSGDGGFVLTGTGSSEPDDARRGDGHTNDDLVGFVVGTPDTSGFIRAERSGSGDGRVYSLFYEGRDQAGNVGSCAVVTAEVPHDQRKDKNARVSNRSIHNERQK